MSKLRSQHYAKIDSPNYSNRLAVGDSDVQSGAWAEKLFPSIRQNCGLHQYPEWLLSA